MSRFTSVWSWLRHHALWLLLGIIAIKQATIVATVPQWSVPDESAHFQYVRTLYLEHRLPELRGRLIVYDPAMLEAFETETANKAVYGRVKQSQLERYWNEFPAERSDRARYNTAGAYSPIYYALVGWPVAIHRESDVFTQLHDVRLVSSLLLVIIVWLTYRLAWKLRPSRSFAIAASIIVGFHPGFSGILAGVNNDALLIAGCLFVFDRWLIRWRNHPPTYSTIIAAAIATGLVVLIKPVGMSLIVLGCVLLFWAHRWNMRRSVRQILLYLSIAGLIGSLWIIREYAIGAHSFLSDASLWNQAKRTLPSLDLSNILRIELNFRIPRMFMTYWDWFVVETTPIFGAMVVSFWAVACVCAVALAGIVRRFFKNQVRMDDEMSKAWLYLSAILMHFVIIGALYWQNLIRHQDFVFLSHGRYQYIWLPLVMILLVYGLEALVSARFRHVVHWTLAAFFVGFFFVRFG